MLSLCDQIERALDSVLDGVLNKTMRTVAWLVDTKDRQEVCPKPDLPDIIKDIQKASMTLRDLQPDLLTPATTTGTTFTTCNHRDGAPKRCKSMGDLCCSNGRQDTNNNDCYSNNNNASVNSPKNNTLLNRSFGSIGQASTITTKVYQSAVMHRQESYHGESDIELEPIKIKQTSGPCHRQCRRCSSDPLQQRTRPTTSRDSLAILTNFTAGTSSDLTPCAVIRRQTVGNKPTDTPVITLSAPDSNSNSHQLEIDTELESQRAERSIRSTQLIYKHFPEVRHNGALESAGDEQLCRQIVSELKTIADNFDEMQSGKGGMLALQDTLQIDLKMLALPRWLRHRVGPTLLKASLNLAMHYQRL